MTFVLLCLASLSVITSRSVCVAANSIVLFFLWLSNISSYICTTSCLCIHLSADVRLLPRLGYHKQCCSECWGACIFLNYGFLRIYPQERDHMITLFFIF